MADYLASHRAWGYGLRSVGRETFRALEPQVADPPETALFAEQEGSLDAARATRAWLSKTSSWASGRSRRTAFPRSALRPAWTGSVSR